MRVPINHPARSSRMPVLPQDASKSIMSMDVERCDRGWVSVGMGKRSKRELPGEEPDAAGVRCRRLRTRAAHAEGGAGSRSTSGPATRAGRSGSCTASKLIAQSRPGGSPRLPCGSPSDHGRVVRTDGAAVLGPCSSAPQRTDSFRHGLTPKSTQHGTDRHQLTPPNSKRSCF
jgi:hypothetical protein